jgi:hypothetical protein
MGAAFWPFASGSACGAWQNALIVARRISDEGARRSAAGSRVLLLFALGALGMLGTAAYGLAHGQHGQRSSLERRFEGRAQLGAALVGSLFAASAPAQQDQAAERFGDKVDTKLLTRQASAGGSNFIAIADPQGHLLAGLEAALREVQQDPTLGPEEKEEKLNAGREALAFIRGLAVEVSARVLMGG